MIRQNTGLEKIMILVTGLRKYLCLNCATNFRAPDRRKRPRPDAQSIGQHLADQRFIGRMS